MLVLDAHLDADMQLCLGRCAGNRAEGHSDLYAKLGICLCHRDHSVPHRVTHHHQLGLIDELQRGDEFHHVLCAEEITYPPVRLAIAGLVEGNHHIAAAGKFLGIVGHGIPGGIASVDGKRTGRGIFLADATGDIDHAVDGEAFVGGDLKRLDRDAPEVGLAPYKS